MTYTDVVSQIVATLRLTDPDLDTSTGTTTRKIIDAAAEAIAEAKVDNFISSYQYDIDSKIDADLDDFVGQFGMARLPAKRASGVVTFSRSLLVTDDTTVFLPVNTQVLSNTSPPIVVQTTAGAFMPVGSSSASVSVQAVEAGPSGNVAAGTLTLQASPLAGVSGVTNIRSLTGGVQQETDSALRKRWKETAFRNLAGTEQMYLGVALDDADCYAASVVGSSKRRREQVQVISGVGQTTVQDAVYTYAEPVFVGANIDSGDILIPGADYAWNTSTNPPYFTAVSPRVVNGNVYEVDFEYVSSASRNVPDSGITNRVDVWVGGTRSRSAVQSLVFRTDRVFNSSSVSSSDPLSRFKYRRDDDDIAPVNGNYFVRLAYGPILAVPSQITIGGKIFGLATASNPIGTTATIGGATIYYAYRVVHDITPFGLTATSRFGLEWSSATNFFPTNNSVFSIGGNSGSPYLYNGMIKDIADSLARWRLGGIDAKIHQAKRVDLRLSVAIVYATQASQSVVDSEIDRQVAEFLTGLGFQSRVQVSDLLQVIHNVSGVDNVRFMYGADWPGYVSATPNSYDVGIQKVVNGAVINSFVDTSTGRPLDVALGDDSLPTLESIHKYVRAENTFGSA